MEVKTKKPMTVVEDAVTALSRMASLCFLMSLIDNRGVNIRADDVGQVMTHLGLCLDEQIKALDGIQWN